MRRSEFRRLERAETSAAIERERAEAVAAELVRSARRIVVPPVPAPQADLTPAR